MSSTYDGIAASPGIVIGPARVLRWETPQVSHGGSIEPDQIETEIARFLDACGKARERTHELQQRTLERMGAVEAQIFEPQLLMLEDPELVGGTITYIRENHLSAERAFEWRVLEWEARWSHTAHPMVLDKLNDLADIQGRVLRCLLDLPDPDVRTFSGGERVILVVRDLTPSVTVQLDRSRVLGIAMDAGTRTSHSAILARALGIPAVVSLGRLSEEVRTGDELILDGRTGRVIVSPGEAERQAYRERDFQIREWEQELLLLAHLDAVTRDGTRVALRANIDLPSEAATARAHGAEGIGLFRTEFLVVGRNSVPGEEEQFVAYRQVGEVFPDAPVIIRTYDLGGDKFPAFLHMQPEENPFLGWRAIRVCLDEPVLFRAQIRALLRAMAGADIRIMLPLVNEIAEIEATRELIDQSADELEQEGIPAPRRYSLGAMVETPGAAIIAAELAQHVDFLSIGTNDLVQYTLAVDRGNSRLARLYNPFHPAVVRLLYQVVEAGREAGVEVSVCGELAGNPLGAFMLIGMGIDSLSVGPSSLAEIKKLIRACSRSDAERAVQEALHARRPGEIIEALTAHLSGVLDLSLFTTS
ncbi:MAG: phosphoenolpyruvate--protein phosphotransferase [Gemmatimonadota bacterium]|nr:phosphoenolpyruvate--protein phosphotransferase [Gemmatimonadota bacterium]